MGLFDSFNLSETKKRRDHLKSVKEQKEKSPQEIRERVDGFKNARKEDNGKKRISEGDKRRDQDKGR